MIRVGLAGFGLGGSTFHAPLIRACEGLELAAILTSRDVPLRVGTLDELIARSDLVVVATPNATHYSYAKAALEMSRHVVVEKPFTATLEEAETLIALAEHQQRIVTVFQNRRWDSDFLTLTSVLPQLGTVQLFEAHWDRFRLGLRDSWKEEAGGGTGLLGDLGSHMIDQALQLFGLPDALQADLARQRAEAKVEDYFALTLYYGSMRAVLSASTLVSSPRLRFAVHGTEGSFLKYGLDPQEEQLKGGLVPGAPGYGCDPEPGKIVRPDGTVRQVAPGEGRYLSFYQQVVAAVAHGGPPPVLPDQACNVIRVIEVARRSAEIGQRLAMPA